MKAEFVNPFLIASEKIVKMVLHLDLKLGQLTVKEEHIFNDAFIVMIGISGDFRGRVLFCINRETACNIASIMMGKKITRLNEFSESAVGELANMILGRSGIIFSNRGIKVNISPPTIIKGKRLTITPLNKKILCIPIKLSNDDAIEMEIEVTRDLTD